MSVVEIVVARQAIFDRSLQVVAYELLFRSTPEEEFVRGPMADGMMTADVLYSTLNIGVEQLVGDKLMFCNADRDVLSGKVPLLLPPDQTVIEILETVTCDDEIIESCLRLLGLGYQLALDDFVWFDGAERLLELASIVKIDVLAYDDEQLTELVTRCNGFNVALLAEKIETDESLQRCLELGFQYFQGYFLERPRNVSGRTLTGSSLGAARIASSLLSREFEVSELEEILRTEPGLAFQLLQLAGIGARHGLRRQVRTLRDALVLVGPARVQSWLALLMLKQEAGPTDHNLVTALTRARMCEILAQKRQPALASLAYTAGIVSALDLLMGVDTEQIHAILNLDHELHEAAFGETSPVARIVRDVVAYQADPASMADRDGQVVSELDRVALGALTWAVQSTNAIRR